METAKHKPMSNWSKPNPLDYLLRLPEADASLKKYREEWQGEQDRIARLHREIDFAEQKQLRIMECAEHDVACEYSPEEVESAKVAS